MKIGSQAHKELFCQSFMASHLPYEPEKLPWPELDSLALERLRGIPFWAEAIRIERKAGLMVSTYGETVSDPLIKEAIALQAMEEDRHSRLIEFMTQHYGIKTTERPPAELPANIEPAFVRFGYRECIDSFFAFGLFELARQSGFFPESLLAIFDPVLTVEARHILFFVNGIDYARFNHGRGAAPQQATLTLWHYGRAFRNLIDMISSSKGSGSSGFTVTGASKVSIDFSPEKFLETCLQENQRRMSVYDQQLLRPQLIPNLAKTGLRTLQVLPRRKPRPKAEMSISS